MLLSSHALAELSGEVDRVVVLNRGRKMADGDIQELRRLIGIRPRIRLRLGADAPPCTRSRLVGWQEPREGVLEIECAEAEILDRLRALPDAAQAIEVVRPTLDDVYAVSCAMSRSPHETDRVDRRKGITRRLTQSMGACHYAAARPVRAYAELPRRRANRIRKGQPARRHYREPLEPLDFPVPMIALLLSYDAIIGEWERGTLGCCSRIRWPAGKSYSASSPAMSAFSRLRPCSVTARRVWPRCSIPGIWQTTGVTSQHW